MEVKKNFNWDITNNKLTIFIPCYKNVDIVQFAVEQISTTLEPNAYTIIIGNDGFHYDWDDLTKSMAKKEHPVVLKYFSLLHKKQQPRNSCYIRNYAMKRSMSKYYMQKDCTVVLSGDFILHAIQTCDKGYLWRPGNICVLNKDDSDRCIKDKSFTGLGTSFQKRIEPVMPIGVDELKKHLIVMNGQVNFTTFFQYAFCVSTKLIQDMHGYDEEYTSYGYEDTDMFCRLYALGKVFKPDYKTSAYHLWHPNTISREQLISMGMLFEVKNPNILLRNIHSWGEGI